MIPTLQLGQMGRGLAEAAGLLDAWTTNLSVAYGVRKLVSYATRAVRVRRSSDNAEADIGFVGQALDTSTLLAHCGAGNGFVVTLYDQIGTLNATHATASRQPKIVNAGTYLGYLQWDNVDDSLVTASNHPGFSAATVTLNGIPFDESQGTVGDLDMAFLVGGTPFLYAVYDVAQARIVLATDTGNEYHNERGVTSGVRSWVYNGAAGSPAAGLALYRDGSSVTATSAVGTLPTSLGAGVLALGSNGASSNLFCGLRLKDFLIHTRALTSGEVSSLHTLLA